MDFLNYQPEPEPQKSDTIPQLATKETAGMRDRYPKIEHLEAGNIGSWLQERRDQLWESARCIETEADAAKVITPCCCGNRACLERRQSFCPCWWRGSWCSIYLDVGKRLPPNKEFCTSALSTR